MHITAHGPRLRNDLYCVEWDVKLYCTIPYHTIPQDINNMKQRLIDVWVGVEQSVIDDAFEQRACIGAS